MYWQLEKKLVKQQYLLYMSPQYGELRPTSSWDCLVSLGHPWKFQLISRLGSITARHSSSVRQPNFAALNRGHHLCLAERPSRCALAHILVWTDFDSFTTFGLPRFPVCVMHFLQWFSAFTWYVVALYFPDSQERGHWAMMTIMLLVMTVTDRLMLMYSCTYCERVLTVLLVYAASGSLHTITHWLQWIQMTHRSWATFGSPLGENFHANLATLEPTLLLSKNSRTF